jgi:hypothetical protein
MTHRNMTHRKMSMAAARPSGLSRRLRVAIMTGMAVLIAAAAWFATNAAAQTCTSIVQ